MADIIPVDVLRLLCEKDYAEFRKGTLEVEGIVKQLLIERDHAKIDAVIDLLIAKLIYSSVAQHKKGGLIGLSAAMRGLKTDDGVSLNDQHLKKIVPVVLNATNDQESAVRCSACAALSTIGHVGRENLIIFFNDTFKALCRLSADSDKKVQSIVGTTNQLLMDIVKLNESKQFSLEGFIPLLRGRMDQMKPPMRQFLLGWIEFLDSVPDYDMIILLPDFVDVLLDNINDSNQKIQQLATRLLYKFLQEIKTSPNVESARLAEKFLRRVHSPDEHILLTSIKWICELLRIDGQKLVPSYADILGAILPLISYTVAQIRAVASEINQELLTIHIDPAERIVIGVVLATAMRQLESAAEATRVEAINWVVLLMRRHRDVLSGYQNDITNFLLKAIFDPSPEVVVRVLEFFVRITRNATFFSLLFACLLKRFRSSEFLEYHGLFIVRRLCLLMDSALVYKEFSKILEKEEDLDFTSKMVQKLNLILISMSECDKLRALLMQSLVNTAGKDLFISLYSSWCHSPIATISLCLLAQAYQHASAIIHTLREEDIDLNFLAQMVSLIHALETSSLASLRLQLLDPGKCTWLVKSLYSLLMLLPQDSTGFNILWDRLKTVPSFPVGSDKGKDILPMSHEDDFTSMLQQFEHIRNQHHMRAKAQRNTRISTSPALSEELNRSEDSYRSFIVPNASSQQLSTSSTPSQGTLNPGLPPLVPVEWDD